MIQSRLPLGHPTDSRVRAKILRLMSQAPHAFVFTVERALSSEPEDLDSEPPLDKCHHFHGPLSAHLKTKAMGADVPKLPALIV